MSKKPADLLAAAFGMSASAARDFLDRVQEQLTRDVSNQFIVDLVIRMRSKAEAPIVRNTAQAVVAARPPGGEVRLRLTTPTRPREPAKVVPLVGPDPDNPESVRAFRCLESPTDAIFVTGRAGTGKSHLLKYWAGKTKKPGFRPPPGEAWLTLTTTNRRAERLNGERLEKLRGADSVFEATIEGKRPNEKNLPADATLRLRPRAQVIFVRNDKEKRWVNGTFGRVVKASEGGVEVEVRSGEHPYTYRLERETWESYEFRFDARPDFLTYRNGPRVNPRIESHDRLLRRRP